MRALFAHLATSWPLIGSIPSPIGSQIRVASSNFSNLVSLSCGLDLWQIEAHEPARKSKEWNPPLRNPVVDRARRNVKNMREFLLCEQPFHGPS